MAASRCVSRGLGRILQKIIFDLKLYFNWNNEISCMLPTDIHISNLATKTFVDFIMDHFPAVKDPYHPIKIPYVSSEDYDSEGFYDFLDRRAWSSTRLESAYADEISRPNAIGILQTWLYFGTMSEVMGFPIRNSDFVTRDQGRPWITTTQLPAHIQCWKRDVASCSLSQEKVRYQKSAECITAVARQFTNPTIGQSATSMSSILGPEQEFSIIVLLETLFGVMRKVYPRSYIKFEWHYDVNGPFMQLLRSRFTDSCPSLTDRLDRRLRFTGFYYASLLPPRSTKDDHKECTKNKCITDRLDVKTYLTAHVESECQCSHISIDFRRLIPIIYFKVVPLIALEDHGHGLRLKVVPFESKTKTPYVAISHVWSHGLGNLHANSLPECQLRAIRRRVVEAYPEGRGYFWIDTLCVPLEPVEARKQATTEMKNVYQLARMALVFDADLIRSTKECSLEQIVMQITRSRWLTRLWTFQEAVLAKRLVFQFLEGAVDMLSLENEVQEKFNDIVDEAIGVLVQGISFWVSFRQLKIPSSSQSEKFGIVSRDMGWRSTSKAEDESICLATILGMDTKQLLDAPDGDRMRLFWSLQREIPSAILFEPGQKLQDDGFRWAPHSLLNLRMDEDYKMSNCRDSAYVSSQGLTVDCFGFFLSLYGRLQNEVVRFKHKRERTRYVMGRSDGMNLEDWENVFVPELQSSILVLRSEPGDLVPVDGILTSYQREESGTTYVKCICRIKLMKEDSYVVRISYLRSCEFQSREVEDVGDPTDVKQRWCIS